MKIKIKGTRFNSLDVVFPLVKVFNFRTNLTTFCQNTLQPSYGSWSPFVGSNCSTSVVLITWLVSLSTQYDHAPLQHPNPHLIFFPMIIIILPNAILITRTFIVFYKRLLHQMNHKKGLIFVYTKYWRINYIFPNYTLKYSECYQLNRLALRSDLNNTSLLFWYAYNILEIY